MKNNKTDIVRAILSILMIIISLIIIYMLVAFLLGKSPEAIGIISSLIGLLIVNAFRVQYDTGSLQGEFKEFRINVKEGFVKVKEDIKELKTTIKEGIQELKDETQNFKTEIKTEIKNLKRK